VDSLRQDFRSQIREQTTVTTQTVRKPTFWQKVKWFVFGIPAGLILIFVWRIVRKLLL
jgi:hypothetical protein